MPALIDITGQRFGRLLVLGTIERRPCGDRSLIHWLCRCDCGAEVFIDSGHLRSKATRSCGCLNRETTARRMRQTSLRHGLAGTPTHRAWTGLIQRCTNPNTQGWKHYGGRGIAVCDRWRHSFEAFLADMGERPAGLSIDRIDNDGNYEPGNCRWATTAEQNRNKRPSTRKHEEPKP